MTDVPDALGELYRAPLDEFVATRTQLARRLKQDGDATAALAVAALRKPSVSTWVVNQLSVQAPDQVRELLAAVSAVRGASGGGAGTDPEAVREASVRFRGALDAVAAELRRILEVSRGGAGDDALRRALLTAHAAGAGDPGMRESLLRGVVDRELAPPGFDVAGSGEADTPLVRDAIAGLITRPPEHRLAGAAPESARPVEADVRRAEREAAALQDEADRLTAHVERLHERAGRLAQEAREVAEQTAAAEAAMTQARDAARRAGDALTALRTKPSAS